MKMLARLSLAASFLAFLAAFFNPTLDRAAADSILYVSPAGSDSNTCATPSAPCATINAALVKALAGDTIKVALGTYRSTGEQVVLITKSITLLGGWNSAFTSQSGLSVLDGQNARRVVRIHSEVEVVLERFTVENGNPSEGGAGILNEGNLTVRTSLIRNNNGGDSCWGGGIMNLGTLTVESSTLSGNTCGIMGSGGAIYSWNFGGPLTISNSTLENNRAAMGGGIYVNGVEFSLTNSTLSGNFGGHGGTAYGGGGLYLDEASGIINSSTIVNNDGGAAGGGIYFRNIYGSGSLVIKNTILANNTANQGLDCFGQPESAGYNILGNTLGCSFASSSTDKINTRPLVAPLDAYGGPTRTHALYTGSPAIDAGNPAGCTDSSGGLLAADQRGSPRTADGNADGSSICDIGAFEAAPGEILPSPFSTWYVSPRGSNSEDCLSPATPCATIPAALAKAVDWDTIRVASGVYSSNTGEEVVLLDKNITLSGGWSLDFTTTNGRSTIDAGQARRGITILEDIVADISRVNVQNGLVVNGIGAGMYIGFRARVSLVDSLIQDNNSIIEYSDTHHEAFGGGIGMNNYANVTLTGCQVINNRSDGLGGGIFSGDSTLIVNNSLIGGNIGGGISHSAAGEIKVNDSAVVFNSEGGIRADVLRMKNSLVKYNQSSGIGGGILSHQLLEIEDSLIAGNSAPGGGGIANTYKASIINSSIVANRATYGYGGGIYSGGDLDIVNSTISYNQADMPYSDDALGGGIYRAGGNLNIYSATIIGNQADRGGGIWHQGDIFIRNTILAMNQAQTGPNCLGTVRSEGYNLIGKINDCYYWSASGDQLNLDPKMGYPFGWPWAISLRPGSSAIDAGNPAGCTDHLGHLITQDQIGYTRPVEGDQVEGAYCDVGAFEYDPQRPVLPVFLPFASGIPVQ